MARIRTIKPEFFTSEDIVELKPLTRLLYVGLWCEADREGILIWKPKTIRLRYFPGDDKSDFDRSISELLESDLVKIYEVDGKEYAHIPSFLSHQSINNRESASKLPQPPRVSDASVTRESGVQGEGKGKEGKGRERKGTRESHETSLPDDFQITGSMREWFGKQGFHIDINIATSKWQDAMLARCYKYKDWQAAWRNGMRKHNEWHLQENKIVPISQPCGSNVKNKSFSEGLVK